MAVKKETDSIRKIKKPSKIVVEEELVQEQPKPIIPTNIIVPELTITEPTIPKPTIPEHPYIDSTIADGTRERKKANNSNINSILHDSFQNNNVESTLKRDLRRATDANHDLLKEIELLKEENKKLKEKEEQQSVKLSEYIKLMNEYEKYKLYYDKMHLNNDNYKAFLDTHYTKSNVRSHRVKCSDMYSEYTKQNNKHISEQAFYAIIENLVFPKVIVNGKRYFSNILVKE